MNNFIFLGLHYDANTVYLSLKDGYLTSVDIKVDEATKQVNLGTGEMLFKSEGISYNGIVVSPNKVFWAILET